MHIVNNYITLIQDYQGLFSVFVKGTIDNSTVPGTIHEDLSTAHKNEAFAIYEP